ncbi:MAG: hypothetical protein M1821_002272 [Bathelium mastoideum]|nr:MAG: hypothetical protein M1821_002272 [Bathelium mastoideum]KAI9685778.1 MAG: hypothetical protein M1822_004338 [Bathelium mastoideum]
MSGRQPTIDDFPANEVALSLTAPPNNQPPTNVLILLHGLGDTNASFETLGKQLSLPETTCISIRGPKALPFDLDGFHWGDDIVFDQATGNMDLDTGFQHSTRVITEKVIKDTLIKKCKFKSRNIMIFGFGQGGMAAVATARDLEGTDDISNIELGGVVSVGGVLPESSRISAAQKCRTPVLICGGEKSSALTDTAVNRMQNAFTHVEVRRWKKVGDGMPANREEMTPIMAFFARRLQSMRGIPKGSIEIA